MMPNAPIRVIYVTNDLNHYNFTNINIKLIDASINLKSSINAHKALEMLKTGRFDCIVTDYMMKEIRGDQFCKKIHETTDIPFILYTDWRDTELAEVAFKSGITDIVKKEPGLDHFNVLVQSIRHAVEKHWQKKLYYNIVEDCPDGVLILHGSTIVYVNDTFLNLFGLDSKIDVIGFDTGSVLKETELRLLNGVDAHKDQQNVPLVHSFSFTLDGKTRKLEASVSSIAYKSQPAKLVFLRDITDKAQREQLLESLHMHASQLSVLEDLNEIRNISLGIMKGLLGFEFASFLVVEDSVLQTVGTLGAPFQDILLRLDGTGVTVRAVRERRTQYVPDVRVDPDYVMGFTDSLSELAAPVFVEGEAVAVLNVESSKIDAFSVYDQQVLEVLANQLGSTFSRLKG